VGKGSVVRGGEGRGDGLRHTGRLGGRGEVGDGEVNGRGR